MKMNPQVIKYALVFKSTELGFKAMATDEAELSIYTDKSVNKNSIAINNTKYPFFTKFEEKEALDYISQK